MRRVKRSGWAKVFLGVLYLVIASFCCLTGQAYAITPQVAAGGYHTVALKSDGSLWAWGENSNGQLGDGTTSDRHLPAQIDSGYAAVAAAGDYSMALKADGNLWGWGSNGNGQ